MWIHTYIYVYTYRPSLRPNLVQGLNWEFATQKRKKIGSLVRNVGTDFGNFFDRVQNDLRFVLRTCFTSTIFIRTRESWLNWSLDPGCRLRTSGICPIPCGHPLPESPLHASVKMALLVARISAQKDPCAHPFQKWPLCASFFKSVTKNQHLDLNFDFYHTIFTTEDGPDCWHR